MNGRRRVETEAEADDADRRRSRSVLFENLGGPSLLDRTENLVNFMDAWKDNPQFAEILSLLEHHMFRESVMNGRRRVEADAEATDAERRRARSVLFENLGGPSLLDRTENL